MMVQNVENTMHQRRIVSGWKRLTTKLGKQPSARVQIWREIGAGRFPAPIELGPNSVGWYEDEIDAWLEARPRRTYGAPAAV